MIVKTYAFPLHPLCKLDHMSFEYKVIPSKSVKSVLNKTIIFRLLKDNRNDPNYYLHQLWCCRTQKSSSKETEILFRERVPESNEKILEKESVREK